MPEATYLIVNADDFGQSPGVNRGVIVAHERGIVTSASLMVRWPAASYAAAYARAHPSLSLGLHVDLGEWVFSEGEWIALYEVVPRHDSASVADEVPRQLEAFGRLVGSQPTHLDSHQHVHRQEPLRSILAGTARSLGVPLRECSPDVRYRGDFYGQTAEGSTLPDQITVAKLIELVKTLPPGLTELSCHPGLGDDLHGMYCSERLVEVNVLCDAQVRLTIDSLGVWLRSF